MARWKYWIRFFIAIGLGCYVITMASSGKAVVSTSIYTDKARYTPGEAVRFTMFYESGFAQTFSCVVAAFSPFDGLTETTVQAEIGETVQTASIVWQPPATDFCGYLVRITAFDGNRNEVIFETAVDVSSSWVKFPRYGYLWDYTEGAAAEDKITALNRYHINALQYYDWQYRHHMPLSDNRAKWQDWSGRWIYGDVLRRYIAAAKNRNMVNMAYNMIYAANMTYTRDGSGVDPAWRLVKADGEDFTCEMSKTRGAIGVLQYFNLLNPDWQDYIFEKEIEALDVMGFDGWHGDTIGEYGKMTTVDGKALGTDENGQLIYYVMDGYTQFLNQAKAALGGHYLTFNPVGAQGIEKVSVSNVDVLYSEFWPWETSRWGQLFDDYYTLQKEIFNAAELSGGKSLVLATYVNYRNPQPMFNTAAVRLLDTVVYASGGARIALGNGNNLLSDEYFPADANKVMSEELQEKTVMMYDFVTAYQNLLRDGQKPANREIILDQVKQSDDGKSGTVWTFAMENTSAEVIHFINLTGTDNLWRDENQTKREPQPQAEIPVRVYTDFDMQTVYWATPDGDTLMPQALDFTVEQDAKGRCAVFTLPSLSYWSMVFMR